ncbi:unnamed protein product [Effrenium voratum]|nr:unnamed protein product [Effrenium voratum]
MFATVVFVSCNLVRADLHLPKLSRLEVQGNFPAGKRLVPFEPAFPSNNFDYKCYLDNMMDSFDLGVEPERFAVLSELRQDGEEVTSRSQLKGISVPEGSERVFSISLSSTHSRNASKYTLQVIRRLGFSTSLKKIHMINGHLKEPFYPESESNVYHALQDVKEDFAEVECVKQDASQHVLCEIEERETIGEGKPSEAELILFPNKYTPSLEERLMLVNESPGPGGRVVKCTLPIDTWRQVVIGINITSADKTHRRHIRIVLRREGCAKGGFYHEGECVANCPIFHYKQLFNWRCGVCGNDCEFCSDFATCHRCRLDTEWKTYELRNKGCNMVEVHPNRTYFYATWYLGVSCAVLCTFYSVVGAVWFVYAYKAEPEKESFTTWTKNRFH